MKMEIKLEKNKGHTIYRTKDKKRVPGTTTITGILDKPALKFWANDLGLKGINVRNYVDNLADIGTLAHAMIEQDMAENKLNLDEWSKEKIDKAENSFIKYLDWRKDKEIKTIFNEKALVSEKYLYGGQIDIYCELDGRKTLIDIKTCKAIYPEVWLQIAAYKQLLIENGYPVEKTLILRVGRDDNENGFECLERDDLSNQLELFLTLRKAYELRKVCT